MDKKLLQAACLWAVLAAFCGPALGSGHNQAVIIQAYDVEHGGMPHPSHNNVMWNDIGLMTELLDTNKNLDWAYPRKMQMSRVTQDRIHVLYGNGQDYSNPAHRYDPKVVYQDQYAKITDAPADTWHIRHIFDSLATVMQPGDSLFVYTFGHGGCNRPINPANSTHSFLEVRKDSGSAPGYDLWDTTFGTMTKQVSNLTLRVYVLAQCYCSGFLDDLVDPKSITVSFSKGYGPTLLADNKPKHGSPLPENEPGTADSCFHGEVNFHFMNALRGQTLWGSPNGWNSPTAVDADYRRDGRIEFWEAATYAHDKSSFQCPYYQEQTAWGFAPEMPGWPRRKVNHGGALAVGLDDSMGSVLYAFRGNRKTDFFAYEIDNDSWVTQPAIPRDNYRAVWQGATLACINDTIYANRGYKSLKFSQYVSRRTTAWTDLAPVPSRIKTPGCGSSVAAVAQGNSRRKWGRILILDNRRVSGSITPWRDL